MTSRRLLRSPRECNELDWAGFRFESTIVISNDSGCAFSIDVERHTTREFNHAPRGTTACQVSAVNCLRSEPLFVTGDNNGVLRLWDLREPHCIPIAFTPAAGSDFNCCAFSPCERFVQGATENDSVWVFDVRNLKQPVHVLQHGTFPGIDRAQGGGEETVVSKKGTNMSRWSRSSLLATCGEDTTLRIWDVRRGDPLLTTITAHTDAVNCAAFSPDELLIVSGCDGRRVALHSLTSEDAAQTQRLRYKNHADGDQFAGLYLPFRLPGSGSWATNDEPMPQS